MSRSARHGFTRVELMVLIGIFAMLICLLLPACRNVRPAAARAKCQNNLKQLILAFHNYESTRSSGPVQSSGNSNASTASPLPTGCIGPGTTPEERLSWVVALLPYLEQDSLYRQLELEKGYAGNLPAVRAKIGILLCPASKEAFERYGVTNYVAMSGIGREAATQPAGAAGNGFMGYDRLTRWTDILDGTANTIALMETRSGLGPWAQGGPSTLRGFDPTDLPLHGDQRPFGDHDKVMQAAMADGSVLRISTSIDPKKLAAAITIAGGEPPVDLGF
jgi:hypothetical protein